MECRNNLTKEDIISLLNEINFRLEKDNAHGEIYLTGGASLALVFDARYATRDIDALFEPKEYMRKIFKEIASDYDLDDDWLNDGVKGYVTPSMKFEVLFEYSNLKVFSANAESLLAMKLTAARQDRSDMDDSIVLMKELNIQSEGELFEIISKYAHPKYHTIQSKYFTKEAFVKYKNCK